MHSKIKKQSYTNTSFHNITATVLGLARLHCFRCYFTWHVQYMESKFCISYRIHVVDALFPVYKPSVLHRATICVRFEGKKKKQKKTVGCLSPEICM